MQIQPSSILNSLGINSIQLGNSTGIQWIGTGPSINSNSPINGEQLGTITTSSISDYENIMDTAEVAFKDFRKIPAPKRGELVRQLGIKLRDKKTALGQLVSLEMGKSLQEGCDRALATARLDLTPPQRKELPKKLRWVDVENRQNPEGLEPNRGREEL